MQHANYATKADIANLRAELSALETRLIGWMAVTGVVIIAAVRLL